jgi:hypothetical protein
MPWKYLQYKNCISSDKERDKVFYLNKIYQIFDFFEEP